jgi:hypothetical protein
MPSPPAVLPPASSRSIEPSIFPFSDAAVGWSAVPALPA